VPLLMIRAGDRIVLVCDRIATKQLGIAVARD